MTELIAIIIGAVVLLILVQLASKKTSKINRAYYQRKWNEIMTMQKTSKAAARLAVIEADKLLDRALREQGYKGQTMGDRLKSANRTFRNPNAVWSAHKLRNKLAHEDIEPKRPELQKALSNFEKALKQVGAL